MRRVVITGAGIVSPLGNNLEENWSALIAGRSGIDFITHFETAECPVKIAGEVKNLDSDLYVDKKEARRYDPCLTYAVAAAQMAMDNSGLSSYDFDHERAGTIVGSGIGGFGLTCDTHEDFLKGGYRKISPFFIPMAIINMASGIVSIKHKLLGPNTSIVTACATGTHAIGEAACMIQRGIADIMVAGGTEAPITPTAVGGFASMKALSRSEDPKTASRPFDANRSGFVIAEGATLLVLEGLDHALARGANILAEVVGYGLTSDAYHITSPDESGQGARRCMAMAIKDAGISPNEVDYINAHGTSTEYNDKFETKAIKELFGEHAYKLKISSTKSMTGHMLGATGAAEALYCALAIKHGIIPPTINLDTPDPDCDLDYTPNKAVKADITYALSNSFGFGGTNASLLIKKFNGQ